MDFLTVLEVFIALFIPFAVTLIGEVLKAIPAIPVTNKNVKLIAFIISLFGVPAFLLYTGAIDLSISGGILGAGAVVSTYTSAVGFYETLKKLFKKVLG